MILIYQQDFVYESNNDLTKTSMTLIYQQWFCMCESNRLTIINKDLIKTSMTLIYQQWLCVWSTIIQSTMNW